MDADKSGRLTREDLKSHVEDLRALTLGSDRGGAPAVSENGGGAEAAKNLMRKKSKNLMACTISVTSVKSQNARVQPADGEAPHVPMQFCSPVMAFAAGGGLAAGDNPSPSARREADSIATHS